MANTVLCQLQRGFYEIDVRIPNSLFGQPGEPQFHPHLCLVFVPGIDNDKINKVFCSLHGGKGTSTNHASSIGILFVDQLTGLYSVNWPLLERWTCIFVVPQGQACTGVDPRWGPGNNPYNPYDINSVGPSNPIGITGWDCSKYVRTGYNDGQFLADVSTYIGTRWPGKKKVLSGHSTGGFAANWAWYNQSTLWDHITVCSGPISQTAYTPTLGNPPARIIPYYSQYGFYDDDLGIYNSFVDPAHNQFYAPTWREQQRSYAAVDYLYVPGQPVNLDTRISDWTMLQHRIDLDGGSQVVNFNHAVVDIAPSKGMLRGTRWRWDYQGAQGTKFRLEFLSGLDGTPIGPGGIIPGSHSPVSHTMCTSHRMVSDWAAHVDIQP